jgi:hypothetical protein
MLPLPPPIGNASPAGYNEYAHVTPGEITTVKVAVTTAPALSLTCTVKLNVPEAVGVPEIVPLVDRLRPPGRDPDVTDQV